MKLSCQHKVFFGSYRFQDIREPKKGPTLKIYEFFVLSPIGLAYFFVQTLDEICYLCFSNRFYLVLISLREPSFILMGL